MYPQTVVPSGDGLHTILTNGMDVAGSGVIFTGDYYTANKDNLAWSTGVNEELNPVYEYKGKRYVRVTPFQYDANSKYHDNSANNNSGTIGRNTGIRWFKVEPIKWIILNYGKLFDSNPVYDSEIKQNVETSKKVYELYAADVLMGGIAFNNVAYSELWTNSDVKTYLNGDFYNQAFSSNDKLQIQESRIYNNNSNGGQSNTAAYNLNFNHFVGTGLNPTDQKIYLLSRYELSNAASPYVTTNPIFVKYNDKSVDESRIVTGTDYARAHNLQIASTDSPYYWTRTAYSGTTVFIVHYSGSLNGNAYAYDASLGTRPALTMFCFAL